MNFVLIALLGAGGLYLYNKSKESSSTSSAANSNGSFLNTLENDLDDAGNSLENEFTGSNSESTQTTDDSDNSDGAASQNDGSDNDGMDSAQDFDNG